jgi:hypothetical protein
VPAALIPALILGGTAIGGAAISAGAAGHAANTQAQAADQAAQLQYQLGQQNLGFQEQQYQNSLGLSEPFYNTGTQALGTLSQLLGLNPTPGNTSVFQHPFGNNGAPSLGQLGGPAQFNPLSLGNGNGAIPFSGGIQSDLARGGPRMVGTGGFDGSFNPNQPSGQPGSAQQGQPGTPTPASSPGAVPGTGLPPGFLAQTFDQKFTAPSLDNTTDPGYKARLDIGRQMLENSAAAHGGILSGGTGQAEQQYGQDFASNEYQNVYNRALQNYNTSFNTFNQNQSNIYNRYASLAGLGQTTAQQLGNAGLATGANVSNDLLATGGAIGNDLNNAAAARASGYVGVGNAISGGLSGLGNLGLMYQLLQNQGNNQGSNITNNPW